MPRSSPDQLFGTPVQRISVKVISRPSKGPIRQATYSILGVEFDQVSSVVRGTLQEHFGSDEEETTPTSPRLKVKKRRN